MCYSAQVMASFRKYERAHGAGIDIKEFVRLYAARAEDHMAGLLFDYIEGYLRVAFKPVSGGDFRIDFHFHGDGVITTSCDDHFVKGDSELAVAPELQVSAFTFGTTGWFFTNMLAWLEAVICGVHECAFVWEAEGPEGSLRWFRNGDGRGRLFLTWDGLRDQSPVECKVLLNKVQMVQAFYQAFLDLVASPDYCPLVHEPVTFVECIAYVLDENDTVLLSSTLAGRSRADAYALVDAILNFGFNEGRGGLRRVSLATFLERAANRSETRDRDPARVDAWIDPKWDDWSRDQRLRSIEESYGWDAWYSSGEKLSTLKSPVVEAWLTKASEPGSGKTP